MTTKVLQYLDPKSDEDILDIGCGDGVLTAKIAPLCKSVKGLDSSTSFIETANDKVVPLHMNTEFHEHDCLQLRTSSSLQGHVLAASSYEKVFSNAAMHWILRDEATRVSFFSDVFCLLKSGGTFVFEQGGAGNVAEAHAAIISVLHHAYDVPLKKIREVDPWFFPSEQWMHQTLERAGFVVEKLELEYRPTKLTSETADGSGGLHGWIRLMAALFLDVLEDSRQRTEAVNRICDVLQDVVTREEDGSQNLGYVRLRAVARKPR